MAVKIMNGVRVLLACLLVGVAASVWAKVISDHDENVDFSAFTTYAWLSREGSADAELPEHLRIRLQRVTEEVLAEKGFEPSPAPPQTDLLLTYYLGLEKELRIDWVVYGASSPWGYGSWGGYDYGYAQAREYSEGTLVLDIVDARTRKLVWTGRLEKTIRSANPPGDQVERTVKKLLADFPPKTK
jgi:hypothetical protein